MNILFAQEICDNGIDDDLDGLVDLNDIDDCKCKISESSNAISSLIPNESFENKVRCPSSHSQLTLLDFWSQASAATSDYFDTCGYRRIHDVVGVQYPPNPLPSGSGYVGFYNGNGPGNGGKYKEYVGCCLLDTLHADTPYRIELFMSLGIGSLETNLSIYGSERCSNLPFGGSDWNFGCPTNGPGWVNLDGIEVTLDSTSWTKIIFSFTPTRDITAIVLGPKCINESSLNYYYVDNLVLNAESRFTLNDAIQDSGFLCLNNLKLKAISEPEPNSYQWYKNGIALVGETSQIIAVDSADKGIYSVRYTYPDGCVMSAPYNVKTTSISADVDLIAGCESMRALGEINVSNILGGKEPYLIGLDNGVPSAMQDFDFVIPGMHEVKIVDSNFCTTSILVVVDTILTPEVSLPKDSGFCDSIDYFLVSQTNIQDVQYFWSTTDTTENITVNEEGLYWVKAENKCGEDKDSIRLFIEHTTPKPQLGEDSVYCDIMPNVLLNGGKSGNGESYLWSNGSNKSELEINREGEYWVISSNRCGTSTDTINIGFATSPIIKLGLDTPLCGTFSYAIDAGLDGLSYLWEPFGETTQVIFARNQGVYRVTVTDTNGCFATDELEITTNCESSFYIPNAFSPNGDGLNERFNPVFLNIYDYRLLIFNRWGEMVFKSEDQTSHWDGSYKGLPVQQGSYYYVLSYKRYENKEQYNLSGVIYLIR